MSALGTWWDGLQRREQRMVAVMLVAVAAFVYWYALLSPLHTVRDDRIARYDAAVADQREVSVAVAALRGVRGDGAASAPMVDAAALVAHAAAVGVVVARQRTAEDGLLEVGIDAVAAPALFAWLDAASRDLGVAPTRLQVEATGASVRAVLAFALTTPAGPTP